MTMLVEDYPTYSEVRMDAFKEKQRIYNALCMRREELYRQLQEKFTLFDKIVVEEKDSKEKLASMEMILDQVRVCRADIDRVELMQKKSQAEMDELLVSG